MIFYIFKSDPKVYQKKIAKSVMYDEISYSVDRQVVLSLQDKLFVLDKIKCKLKENDKK